MIIGQVSPVPFLKFQIASRLRLLIASESKKKESRYASLNEAEIHTYSECGLRLLPQYHNSCIKGYLSHLLNVDIFSENYIR